MLKKLAIGLGVVILAVPVYASAQAVTGNNDKLIAIYTRLVQILQQQLAFLQNKPHAVVAISPASGPAPLTVTFTVTQLSGTEALDFGDGHSSGSNGCVKNSRGYCDLTQPLSHAYSYPGTYTVTLFDSMTGSPKPVSTASVTVTAVN